MVSGCNVVDQTNELRSGRQVVDMRPPKLAELPVLIVGLGRRR
jgi:hypothetical protein